MGTNYYWKNPCPVCGRQLDEDNIKVHIGRETGCFPYCWDCGTILSNGSTIDAYVQRTQWLSHCPSCGKPAEECDYAFTFIWTLLKHYNTIKDLAIQGDTRKLIVDEYGKEYTADEFLKLLRKSPPTLWQQHAGEFS